MTWFTSGNVSVANGGKVVTVHDGFDTSNIVRSDAIIIDDNPPVEINTTRTGEIELLRPWPYADVTNRPCRVLPTSGDFQQSAEYLRHATSLTTENTKAINEWTTSDEPVTFTDPETLEEYTVKTPRMLEQEGQVHVDDASGYADRAETARDAAQDSEARAATSEANAAASETAADADRIAASNHKDDAKTYRDQAETAKGHAQAAQTGAETAEAGAVQARTDMETGRDAAIDAQTAAETAQAAAEAAEAGAVTAKNQAQTAEAGADAARIAAETAEANAETAETGAEGARDTALAHKNAAAVSAGNAAASEGAAALSESNASDSEAAALASENQAKTYKDQAGGYATNAGASAGAADADRIAAETARAGAEAAESNAAASETNAAASETSAGNKAAEAGSHALDANNAKTAAQAAQAKAEDWADNGENIAVEAGKYSAKHHAAKASASAAAADADRVAAQTAKTQSETAQAAAEGAQAAAEAAESSAAGSASAAQTYKSQAQTAQQAAESAELTAEQHRDDAEGFKNQAGASEGNAASSASAAAGSASTASTKASQASSSASSAATSATEAEDARDLAYSYRNSTESYKNQAGSSASAASASETSAAADAASALSSKNAAKTSETNAANSKSAAAASASSASSSASSASTSASNAAQSAAEALASKQAAETAAAALQGAMIEMGGWDASGGAYPTIPEDAAGEDQSAFWKITKAGTLGGVAYGVGDSLCYSSTLTEWYKIDNTESVTSVNGKQGVVTISLAELGGAPSGHDHDSDYLKMGKGAVTADFDNYTESGTYHVNAWAANNVQNGPTGSYDWGMLRVSRFNGVSSTYVVQEYIPHNSDGIWLRVMWGGNGWNNWREIYSSSSDGPGSGLNADLLDGLHASAFALAGHDHNSTYSLLGHTHSYVPLSGGTMTGKLWLNAEAELPVSKYLWGNGNRLIGRGSSGDVIVGDESCTTRLNATSGLVARVAGANYDVYHVGHKPTLGELGAAAASHTHSYLPLSGGTLTGPVYVNGYVSNNTPSADQMKLDGYGLIGNRGTTYITNAKSGGTVQVGIGDAHNSNPVFIFGSTQHTSYQPITAPALKENGVSLVVKYAAKSHSHTAADVGAAPSSHSHAWSAITGKPSTYTPASHSHAISDITDLQNQLNAKQATLNTNGTYTFGALQIADPGQNEGIKWLGGNLWGIFESPNTYSNSSGNLQFDRNGTREMTLNTSGQLWTRNQGTLYGTSNKPSAGDIGAATSGHGHTGLGASAWNGVQSVTPYGYIDFGPANTSHAHIYTDRPNFYFNKPLVVNGTAVSMSGHTHDYSSVFAAKSHSHSEYAASSHSHSNYASTSHTHSRLYEEGTVDYGWGGIQFVDVSGSGGAGTNGAAPENPTSDWYYHMLMNHNNSSGYYFDLAACFHSDAVYHRRVTAGAKTNFLRFFDDSYHPNADKWTTARTLTLTGNVTGSVTMDGSGNVSMATTCGWADKVDVNTSTSTSYYNMLWHSGDTVYGTNGKGWKVRPSDGHSIHTGSAQITGDLVMGGGSSYNSWLTLHGADASSERTGISIGESGKHGSAALHIYYTGDGYAHMGMGSMSASSHASNRAIQFYYQSNAVTFLGATTHNGRIYANGGLELDDNDYLYFGTGNDVEFFCNGSHMYTDLNSGIGNWYIRDGSTTRFTFDDAGHFTATGNITAYSDRRLKDNLAVIGGAMARVRKLSGYTYDRIDVDVDRQAGLIAQQVQKVLPEVVTVHVDPETKQETLGVNYGAMAGLWVEAFKEQDEVIQSQQEEINELTSRMEKLEEIVAKLMEAA